MSDISDWEKLSDEVVYNGYRKIVKKTYRLPSGRVTSFDIKLEGPAVSILALTPEQKIIVIRQFRPGPEEILLELPGGGLDQNKTPKQCAEEELLQETGFRGELKFLCTSRKDAWSTHLKHNFVATNCQKVQEQKLGPNEFIALDLIALSELRELLRQGKIADFETAYLGLDYLKLL